MKKFLTRMKLWWSSMWGKSPEPPSPPEPPIVEKPKPKPRPITFGFALSPKGVETIPPALLGFASRLGSTSGGKAPRIFRYPEELDDVKETAAPYGLAVNLHCLFWPKKSWIHYFGGMSVFGFRHKRISRVLAHMREVAEKHPYVQRVEVLNEVIDLQGIGFKRWTGMEDLTVDEFEQYCEEARRLWPRAKLYINEYGVEFNVEKRKTFLELAQRLWMKGLIDSIGIQGHYEDPGLQEHRGPYLRDIQRAYSEINKAMIPWFITECDLVMPGTLQGLRVAQGSATGESFHISQEKEQAVFARSLAKIWKEERPQSVMFWDWATFADNWKVKKINDRNKTAAKMSGLPEKRPISAVDIQPCPFKYTLSEDMAPVWSPQPWWVAMADELGWPKFEEKVIRRG